MIKVEVRYDQIKRLNQNLNQFSETNWIKLQTEVKLNQIIINSI